MDLWGVKDITGRHFFIEDNEENIKESIFKKLDIEEDENE